MISVWPRGWVYPGGPGAGLVVTTPPATRDFRVEQGLLANDAGVVVGNADRRRLRTAAGDLDRCILCHADRSEKKKRCTRHHGIFISVPSLTLAAPSPRPAAAGSSKRELNLAQRCRSG